MKSICATGHRQIYEDTRSLSRRIYETVLKKAAEGYTTFYAGGALGFDTLFAEAVLFARRTDPRIRLALVFPCRDQAAKWSREDRERYARIAAAADETVCLFERYTTGCMHARNRYMVDHSDLCLAYLVKNEGGTAYTVRYAQSRGVSVENLAIGRASIG